MITHRGASTHALKFMRWSVFERDDGHCLGQGWSVESGQRSRTGKSQKPVDWTPLVIQILRPSSVPTPNSVHPSGAFFQTWGIGGGGGSGNQKREIKRNPPSVR